MPLGTAQSISRVALVVLVLGLSPLAGCKRGAPEAAKSAAPVLVVALKPATVRTVASHISLTGAIAAWQPLSVNPAINGLQVLQVLADEGQHVAKGQVLAQLDDRTLRAQLADAQARLASAEASVSKARTPGRSEELSTARAALNEAEARRRSAQADLGRYEILFAEGAVSNQEIDVKRVTLASARSVAQQARDRVSTLTTGGRREDIQMAQSAAAQARAAVSQAQIQVSQARVIAPAAGLILAKTVLIGDVATVGKPMFTLARDNRLEMIGNVAEADMPRIRVGQTATIGSDTVPGLKVVGRVRQLSPVLSTTSRLASVRIDLPSTSGFKPGMFARAELSLGSRPVLVVPTEAIVSQDGRSRVYVVENGIVRAREVRIGDASGGYMPVLEGLTAGTPVVVEGAGFLKEGDPVAVADERAEAAPQPAASGGH